METLKGLFTIIIAFFLLCFGVSGIASAQMPSFPAEGDWIPITQSGGVQLIEPAEDENPDHVDMYGDAENAAAYVYIDQDFQYFRVCVLGDPIDKSGMFKQHAWLSLFTTDFVGPECMAPFASMLDGKTDEVLFMENMKQDDPDCVANNENYDYAPVISSNPPSTHSEVVQRNEMQYCIAWALALDEMEAAGVEVCVPTRITYCTGTNSRSCIKDVADTDEELINPVVCCPDDDPNTPPCFDCDAEGDTDGDGLGDLCDDCPDDPNKTEPGICGCGVADDDSDGDGVADCIDNCPEDPNQDQTDNDGDGIGDACETITAPAGEVELGPTVGGGGKDPASSPACALNLYSKTTDIKTGLIYLALILLPIISLVVLRRRDVRVFVRK